MDRFFSWLGHAILFVIKWVAIIYIVKIVCSTLLTALS
jgi:hypothetical protein